MAYGIPKLWLSELLSRVLNAVAVVLVARMIGVEAYGSVGYVGAVVAYLVVLIQFGSDFIGVRELSKRSRGEIDASGFRSSLWLFRIVLLVPALVLLFGMGLLSSVPLLKKLFWSSILVAGGTAFPLEMVLQSEKKFGQIALVRILFSILNLVGIVALIRFKEDAWLVPAISGMSALIVQAIYMMRLRRFFALPSVKEFIQNAKFLSKAGWPLFLSLLLLAGVEKAGILFLQWMGNPFEVGWYAASYRIFELGNAILVPTATVLFPELSRVISSDDPRQGTATITNGMRLSLTLAGMIVGLTLLSIHQLLPWILGQNYEPSASLLSILALALLFRSVSMFLANATVAVGWQRMHLLVTAVLAVIYLLLSYVLIQVYGPWGVAWSTVIVFAIELLLYCVILRRIILLRELWRWGRSILFGATVALLAGIGIKETSAEMMGGQTFGLIAGIMTFLVVGALLLRHYKVVSVSMLRENLLNGIQQGESLQ